MTLAATHLANVATNVAALTLTRLENPVVGTLDGNTYTIPTPNEIYCWDVLRFLRQTPDDTFDLVFGSPPYGKARRYQDAPAIPLHAGEEWVKWMTQIVLESIRTCKGLVAFVINGTTKQFNWDSLPILLAADLKRISMARAANRFETIPQFTIRKPPIFGRCGIMGSGGPDFWRDDYEFVVCASRGRLPWSNNTYGGSPPKYRPGGKPSHRTKSGVRVTAREYTPPAIANPGNVLWGNVGKGHMGSDYAHKNEAPFPEWLAERFVGSFCPPSGLVLDPFIGSGTTGAVARKLGRNYVGLDIRESQCIIARERIAQVTCDMIAPKDENTGIAPDEQTTLADT